MFIETPTFAYRYCNGKYKYHRVQINARENRRDNQEWTIQRNRQHWVHKTQNEDKQNKKTQHIQTKPMSNTDPTKLLKWTESGGQVSRDDQKMWCGKPTSKK